MGSRVGVVGPFTHIWAYSDDVMSDGAVRPATHHFSVSGVCARGRRLVGYC